MTIMTVERAEYERLEAELAAAQQAVTDMGRQVADMDSLYRRRAETAECQLAEARALAERYREALEKAAHALDITAEFIADDMGKNTGTAQGIRYDAVQARKALFPTADAVMEATLGDVLGEALAAAKEQEEETPPSG